MNGICKSRVTFSNCATKAHLKKAAGVKTSDFVKKTDLANLKSDKLDKLDIDELKNAPTNLTN